MAAALLLFPKWQCVIEVNFGWQNIADHGTLLRAMIG
jgi:hypothetical protein